MRPFGHLSNRNGTLAMLFGSVCALTSCGSASVIGPPAQPLAAPSCTIEETSRAKLTDEGGRQVYIQPVVAVSNRRGEILVGGERNYVFGRHDGGRWTRATEDSLLGAIVSTNGPAQLVRSPIPTQLLGSVRAVDRDDGTWSVVFAELKRAGAERSDSIARLWYGILDGSRWTTLEVIPVPPLGAIRRVGASAPVERSGLFSWAVILSTAEHPSDVMVLQRQEGQWSYELVPTILASYAAITPASGSDQLLAVVQPDLAIPRDGNSLFLWARRPAWTRIAKVASSSDGAVHDPRLDLLDGTDVLSWLAQRNGGGYSTLAVTGDLTRLPGPVVTLDSAVARGGRRAVFRLRSLPQVWALDHQPPDGSAPEVRLVWNSHEGPSLVGRIHNPFIGPFAAAAQSPSEVAVIGGIHDQTDGVVATVVVRARVRCAGETP